MTLRVIVHLLAHLTGACDKMRVREYTDRIISLIEDGVMDHESVLIEVLHWMSESDVREFALNNLYVSNFVEEEEEEYECLNCGAPVDEDQADFGNCIRCMHDF